MKIKKFKDVQAWQEVRKLRGLSVILKIIPKETKTAALQHCSTATLDKQTAAPQHHLTAALFLYPTSVT